MHSNNAVWRIRSWIFVDFLLIRWTTSVTDEYIVEPMLNGISVRENSRQPGCKKIG